MKTALLLLTLFQSVDLFPVTAKQEKPAVKESGRYLVVFTTQNCVPCRQWKANELPKLGGQFVTKIDADEQPQWGVQSVPSFWIVDRATRKPVKKYTGTVSAETLLKDLQVNSVSEKPAVSDGQASGPIGDTDERTKLIDHLLNDGIHAGRHTQEKLEAMSLEDLETLHTLEHNSGPRWYIQPKQTVRRRRGLFFEWR